jgi:hypothetical protein
VSVLTGGLGIVKSQIRAYPPDYTFHPIATTFFQIIHFTTQAPIFMSYPYYTFYHLTAVKRIGGLIASSPPTVVYMSDTYTYMLGIQKSVPLYISLIPPPRVTNSHSLTLLLYYYEENFSRPFKLNYTKFLIYLIVLIFNFSSVSYNCN